MCLILGTFTGSSLPSWNSQKHSVPIASGTSDLILGFPLHFRHLKLFQGVGYAVD